MIDNDERTKEESKKDSIKDKEDRSERDLEETSQKDTEDDIKNEAIVAATESEGSSEEIPEQESEEISDELDIKEDPIDEIEATEIDESIETDQVTEIQEEGTIELSRVKEYSFTVEGALLFLKEVLNRTDDYSNSEGTIETKTFLDMKYHFLYITGRDWYDQLFQIDLDDFGNIEDMVSVGVGLDRTFSYGIVSMSQGNYLAVLSASHMGNGCLDLYGLELTGEVDYTICPVIDCHYEDMVETAIEYGLTKENTDEISASAVFKDDALDISYEDYDGDGSTDIVLSGSIRLYSYDNSSDTEYKNWYGDFVEEIPCEYVYLYNKNADLFELVK